MKNLSIFLITALILTSTSPIVFKKDIGAGEAAQAAQAAWSESLSRPHEHYDGALFKTIVNFQEYFTRHSLQPGASLDGGVRLMYSIDDIS